MQHERTEKRADRLPAARTHVLDLRPGTVGASEYAQHLVEWGIDSISVNVDAIERTRHNIAVAEARLLLDRARRSA